MDTYLFDTILGIRAPNGIYFRWPGLLGAGMPCFSAPASTESTPAGGHNPGLSSAIVHSHAGATELHLRLTP